MDEKKKMPLTERSRQHREDNWQCKMVSLGFVVQLGFTGWTWYRLRTYTAIDWYVYLANKPLGFTNNKSKTSQSCDVFDYFRISTQN
jgi:hypothetical protein